jgi:hypothetical protein
METSTVTPKAGRFMSGSSDGSMTICVLDDKRRTVEILQESLRCLRNHSIGTSDPSYSLELVDQDRVRVLMPEHLDARAGRLAVPGAGLHRDPGIYVLFMKGYYSLASLSYSSPPDWFRCSGRPTFSILSGRR